MRAQPSTALLWLRLLAPLSVLLLLGGLWWTMRPAAPQRPLASDGDPGRVGLLEVDEVAGVGSRAAPERAEPRLEVEVREPADVAELALARVQGPNGEWLDGCEVEVIPNGRMFARGRTADGGWFRTEAFPKGPALVVARSAGLQGRALWEPELMTGQDASYVVVQLRPAGSIVGSVVHGVDRRPMARARVMALPRGIRPSSFDRDRRAGYALETRTDDLGHFEFGGLLPDAEYVLHAACQGHVSAAAGVVATARVPEPGGTGAPWCEVDVLPALGTLVQFVDGGTGAVLPASFSQTARMQESHGPGDLLPPFGLVLEELDLEPSLLLGREPQGLRAFVYRVPTTSVEPVSVLLTVESPDHLSTESEIPLVLISPQMEVTTVVLHSYAGPLYPVTLRFSGYSSDLAYRYPTSDQVHLEHEYGRGRSLFVVPDRRGEVHLALPKGSHGLRYEGGGGWLFLPHGEADTHRRFDFAGPTVVEMEWPSEPVGVVLDLRDSDGNPKWDICMLYWTRADPGVELPTIQGRGFRTMLLAEGPYWIPSWTPGHYDVWVDRLGVGPGYRIEVPEHGGAPGTAPRVRIDLVDPLPAGAPSER